MNYKLIGKKLLIQLLALLIYGFGIAAIVFSQVGASPFDAVINYTGRLLPIPIPGFEQQAIWLFLWSAIFTLVVFIFTRKKKVVLSLVVSLVISLFVNLWLKVLFLIPVTTMNIFSSYGIGLAGLICLAFGIGLLIANDLIMTPYDEVAVLLESKTGKFAIAKSILDGSSLVLAIILALIIGRPDGKLLGNQIGFFSAIVVFGLGPLIGLFTKLLKKGKKRNEIEQVY